MLLLAFSGCSWLKGDDTPAGPDGGVGDMCTGNSECGAAFICAGGFCQLAGSVGLGGPCSANRDCATDLFCTPQGVCGPAGGGDVGASCATGAECKKELVCVVFGFGGTCEMAGTSDLGGACTASTDCLAGLACAADSTCKGPGDAFPPFTGVECEPEETPFRVYFEVPRPGAPPADFFRLPFPNDARVDATGALNMDDFPRPGPGFLGVDLIDLYVDALEDDFRGFSSSASVTFRFSGQLDFDSIGAGAENMHYIDITPGAPEFGNDRGRRFSYTTGRGLYLCNHAFTVGNDPHQPLLPGHTYAVYLTSSIRSAASEAPSQDADFAAVLAATRPTGDPALENAWDQYQPFRDYLADQNMAPSTIAGAAVFTVQDTTGPVEKLHTAVQGTPVPELKDLTLCANGVTSPCADGDSRICGAADPDFYEIHGRYTVPMYQQGTTPYATPADGGKIVFNASDVPEQNGSFDVCMVMMIPKQATKPAGGWPLVVYAHGTGGTFRGVVTNGAGRAIVTGSTPAAVFSFDGVVHGARRNGHSRDEDSLMFNVINPAAARDNNLQGAVDVMQAFRIPQVAAFNVTGVTGAIDFDPTKLFYFGHSQGSNVGVPAVAVSSEAKGAIFSGAGAYLTDGILNKTSPVDAKGALQFLLGEELTGSHPVMTIWQTYFDRSDTLNFAPLILDRPPAGVPTKHVFMTWATDDTFSPRPTLNIMARAMRIPIANPTLEAIGQLNSIARPITLNKAAADTDRTAALFQYQSDGYDGHFVSTRNPTAVVDWMAFLTSGFNGAPNVP